MLRFFRASRSIQVGTPEVRARSPFSRGRALARSPIGRMRHPVYTKSRLSAAAESLLFGICIRKRYSISLKRPSGPRRFCAVQVFWPKAKTLVQAEFTSAGHVKSSRYGAIAAPMLLASLTPRSTILPTVALATQIPFLRDRKSVV